MSKGFSLLLSTGPMENCTGICLYDMLLCYTIKLTHDFIIEGWGTADFDSKYKVFTGLN